MFGEVTSQRTENPLPLPEELQKKYDSLNLPTQYDYLLAQEKLAAEIRKQNKDLRGQGEALKRVENQLNAFSEINYEMSDKLEQLCARFEDGNEDDAAVERDCSSAAQNILIQAIDSMLNLATATHTTVEKVLNLLPATGSFWRRSPPAWRLQAEEILHGYTEGVDTIHDKLLHLFDEMDIEPIIPEIKTPFSPNLHRAVEQITGGPSRCIAKVIRYGLMKEGKVLRFADVSVFY